MADEDNHKIFEDEELIAVKMRVKDYRRLMQIIERDESMTIAGRHIKAVLLWASGVIAAWLFLWDFVKDRLIGS